MKKFRLIPLAVLASLAMSSCEDTLTKDSMDQVTIEQYLTSDANLVSFTYQLYGPFTWTNYESKFSWCANELTVGNVYHNYGDEGAFFFLSFDKTNAHLLNGYECLYGVISRCNMIINNLDVQAGPGVSAKAIARAKGEAYLMRGYCYYLLTEYWGETYIITNNNNIIKNDGAFSIPKATRASVYKQAEKDYLDATKLLPVERWGNNGERPTQAAAYGMLGKLYLTMGAASTNSQVWDVNTPSKPVFQTALTYADYNAAAVNCLNIALGGATLESKDNYENIFWPKSYNKENLFSLSFEQGPYGAGASRQIMFARSKFMDGGDDYYGGEKGLTMSLFNSFEVDDVRKAACCYYTDNKADNEKDRKPKYTMFEDEDYYYYYNPNKTFKVPPYGAEPESPCLNACRKFVYGVHLTNKFSAPLTFPILRTADLYLMRAEANMAVATQNAVAVPTTVGLEDLNVVRERAGVSARTTEFALYDDDVEVPTVFKDNRDPAIEKSYEYNTYSDTYDLFEERRHEFALECQNWLDLKRIYYRDFGAGRRFIERQDRGWTMGQKLGVEDYAKGVNDYQRTKELHMADPSLPGEKDINTENIYWFFPIPSAVESIGNPLVQDYTELIEAGQYPY